MTLGTIDTPNIPQSTLVDASSAGNATIGNSGVQRAQPSSNLAQANEAETKQVLANQISNIMSKFSALSAEVGKLRKEAESIENPKGFGKFINVLKGLAVKLFGFVQNPTDRLNHLQNEIKILGHQMTALCNKMTASESSGLKNIQPTQVHADMGVQSSSDDLSTAKTLATTSTECIEEIHDEVETQLTETSRQARSFEPFMDRNLVGLMYGHLPDLPVQSSQAPEAADVGGPPPPPPPPPSAVDQKAAFESDMALFQKLQTEGHPVNFSRQIPCADGKVVSVDVAATLHSKAEETAFKRQLQHEAAQLSQRIEALKSPIESLKQQTLDIINTMQGEVASGDRGNQTMTLPSGMQVKVNVQLPCDYSQNPLQFFNDLDRLKMDGLITDSEYGQLETIKRDLTENQATYTQALDNIPKFEAARKELMTASSQTYLPKGSPTYEAIASILSQRSRLPAELQSYWNNFSYDSLDASLKRAQNSQQQKIDKMVAQLEQDRVKLDAAKAQYSQAGVALLDALERSSLSEGEKSRLKNTFSSNDGFTPPSNAKEETDLLGADVSIIKNKDVFQAYKQLGRCNPKGIQTDIEKLTEEIKTLQKSGSSAGLQGAVISKQVQISLEPNLFKMAEQIRGGAQFDLDSLSRAIQTVEAGKIREEFKKEANKTKEEVADALKQVQEFSSALGYPTQDIKEIDIGKIKELMDLQNLDSLSKERLSNAIQTVEASKFRDALKQVQEFSSALGYPTQDIKEIDIGKIKGLTYLQNLDSLSRAIDDIKADRSNGTSSVFVGASKQVQAFSSALGYPTQDPDQIKGLMNLVKHLQTHNSPNDIHILAENVAQSKTYTKTPDAAGMNNAFFVYIQKMA
ncbi:MAG: hypothetical protein LBE99_01290 [Puniceicoccales bacterium]|nr:hypothetical protein [Puniceicoccales bacterium]